jgi:hypothetical protein
LVLKFLGSALAYFHIVFGNCLKVFKLRESSHRMLHSDSLTLAPSS